MRDDYLDVYEVSFAMWRNSYKFSMDASNVSLLQIWAALRLLTSFAKWRFMPVAFCKLLSAFLLPRGLEKASSVFEARVSRVPVNEALYADEREFHSLLGAFGEGFQGRNHGLVVRSAYSIAYSIFAANDIYDVGRKASATVFEILIGHIVARVLAVSPRKKVSIPESGADLPTDYVFDPGPRSRKIHLPIKTSTRERAVQAWVHQLVLERIFGAGMYRGILVVASETKRDTRTGEVIEICVPRQLQMLQSRVAEITRIYYLDPPKVYLELANAFPRVDVKLFDQALAEIPELLTAG